jgi:hypothetical protein
MENKKYEQLIDLIINEQEDKARELFHEIVVEKSREIYESIMDEEMMAEVGEEGEEMVGEVGQLMAEIDAEESGVAEAEDEADIEFDDEAEEAGDELTHDMEAGHDEEGSVEKADLGDIKDKLDDLMAEFEALMSGDDAGDDESDEEEMMEASDDEEAVEESKEEDMDEEVMEAVQLQKVSVTHGDNGSNTKSPALTKPKVEAAGVKPVKFSGHNETVPTGPKGPSNEYSKKEGTLIGDVGNTPGQKKGQQLKAAPKPVTKDGAADKHSPVAKG